MKKNNIILTTLGIILMMGACENEPIVFDSSKNMVGFSSSSVKINEGSSGTVKLYLGATSNNSTTVSLVTSTDGLTIPAESSDYSLSSTSIQMSAVGTYELTINTVDNDLYTGSKSFYINIGSNTAGYQTSAQSYVLVTIVDDEHPLKNWIGTYTVDAKSYGDVINGYEDGAWDEAWTVTTATDPEDDNVLWFTGICYGNVAVKGTFDIDAKTVTFDGASNVATAGGGYGYVTDIYSANEDLMSVAGKNVTASILDACAESKIVGTIEDDGSIHIDNIGAVVPAIASCWDVFDTYWSLNASTKKGVQTNSTRIVKNKFIGK